MRTNGFKNAVQLLPTELRGYALEQDAYTIGNAEEFRLRVSQSPCILLPDREVKFAPSDYRIKPRDLASVLEIATCASSHSAMASIKQGYVTVKGGCRVGICGAGISEGGEVTGIKNISSLSLRIPKEHFGCADEIYPRLIEGGFQSTLIISPPGGGKTSLLRELIRQLSNGGRRLSLSDERGEVAAMWEGASQFEIGEKTDVMSGINKAQGALLLLRAMNPEIIAIDEITAGEDVLAIEQAANCGVSLLATAHARDISELRERKLYRGLLEDRVFKRLVVIKNVDGKRRYELLKAGEGNSWGL